VLHHLADLSVEQVAAQTGAPVSAVALQLSRARAALARLLHDAAGPSGSGRRRCSTGVEH
jgi:RNA polymerase sigma-70 factor (ECF subfamily)